MFTFYVLYGILLLVNRTMEVRMAEVIEKAKCCFTCKLSTKEGCVSHRPLHCTMNGVDVYNTNYCVGWRCASIQKGKVHGTVATDNEG